MRLALLSAVLLSTTPALAERMHVRPRAPALAGTYVAIAPERPVVRAAPPRYDFGNFSTGNLARTLGY